LASKDQKCGGEKADKFCLFVFRKGERRRKVQGKGLWTRAQMLPLQLHNGRQLGKGRESKNR
jgi:hypothetical protein